MTNLDINTSAEATTDEPKNKLDLTQATGQAEKWAVKRFETLRDPFWVTKPPRVPFHVTHKNTPRPWESK